MPFGASRLRLRPVGAAGDVASWGVSPPAKTVATVAAILWAVLLVLILRHRVFVSHDSISNYGHVWWVSEQLWHGDGLPFRMPVIGHGEAFAFPYSFLPWFTASLLHPLLGDWVVTLWIVLGSAGLVAATFWAFPEVRRGWPAATVLVNPALVIAPLIGQLPFIWGSALLMAAIGCWRRQRYIEAAILAGLGQATHPAVILPIALLLVAGWLRWEPDKRQLLKFYAISLVIALPATWIVFVSPVFVDSSALVIIAQFFGTLVVRVFVFIVPILLVLFRRLRWAWLPLAGFIFALSLNVALGDLLDTSYAWGALTRKPDTDLMQFIDSPKFEPAKTYRVLRAGDGKVSMYQIVREGGRLDSEFFPESIGRRSWRTSDAYSRFLRTRRVDFVIVYDSYDRRFRTNEHGLLDRLSARGLDRCDKAAVGASPYAQAAHFDVYAIRREC